MSWTLNRQPKTRNLAKEHWSSSATSSQGPGSAALFSQLQNLNPRPSCGRESEVQTPRYPKRLCAEEILPQCHTYHKFYTQTPKIPPAGGNHRCRAPDPLSAFAQSDPQGNTSCIIVPDTPLGPNNITYGVTVGLAAGGASAPDPDIFRYFLQPASLPCSKVLIRKNWLVLSGGVA